MELIHKLIAIDLEGFYEKVDFDTRYFSVIETQLREVEEVFNLLN